MNTLTETEKAYLAGLIDGEGCIHIAKQYRPKLTPNPIYYLHVIIAQADKQYLEYWRDKVGLGTIQHRRKETASKHLPERYRDNLKDMYAWHIDSHSALDLLQVVAEYMVLKKDQAEIAIRFQRTMNRKYSTQKGRQGGGQVPPEILELREKYRQAIMSKNQREQKSVLEETEPVGEGFVQLSILD